MIQVSRLRKSMLFGSLESALRALSAPDEAQGSNPQPIFHRRDAETQRKPREGRRRFKGASRLPEAEGAEAAEWAACGRPREGSCVQNPRGAQRFQNIAVQTLSLRHVQPERILQ
jgi:hypothetical protein